MTYREKIAGVCEDDPHNKERAGTARQGYSVGHTHALHQCDKIAAEADGEIERLNDE